MIQNVTNNKFKIIIECGIYGKRKRKTKIFYGTESQAKKVETELKKKFQEMKKMEKNNKLDDIKLKNNETSEYNAKIEASEKKENSEKKV